MSLYIHIYLKKIHFFSVQEKFRTCISIFCDGGSSSKYTERQNTFWKDTNISDFQYAWTLPYLSRLRTFKLHHYACGPHHREEERFFEELIMQTESLPISRFDIMDGDEIYVDPIRDGFLNPEGSLQYFLITSYITM